MLEKALNTFHQMQLDFINERLFISQNLHQYFENHFITSRFNTIVTLKSGLIFFIDLTNNVSYKQYIDNNFNLLEQLIESKNRKFIYNKDLKINDNQLQLINYYYPFLKKNIDTKIYAEINNLELLEFTGILKNTSSKENITTGFLSIHSKGVSFIGKNDNESIEEFINKYIKHLITDLGANSKGHVFYSLNKDDSGEPIIKIDEETQKIINDINEKLEKLKDTGKLFAVAPKIQELLKTHFNNVTDEEKQISPLIVKEDYNIFLPEYNNIEVKLNHLTKAIYILFLKHQKIHLNNLSQYKDELLFIYKNISYKNDYDQITESVEQLMHDKNAIFVHLSRIKSTFTLLFSSYYAENYYIQGDRGKEKFIKLNKAKITIEAKI